MRFTLLYFVVVTADMYKECLTNLTTVLSDRQSATLMARWLTCRRFRSRDLVLGVVLVMVLFPVLLRVSLTTNDVTVYTVQ